MTREELFVTTKLWNTYHRPEHVKMACLKQLKDLNLEYIDLYLMHFPISMKFVPFEEKYPPFWIYDEKEKYPKMEEDNVPIIDTWKAMEALVDEGLVRNIGVCNFNTELLRDLINGARIPPSVLQVELHPQLTQKKLIRFCRMNRIQMTAFSSFGGQSYLELSMATKEDLLFEQDVIQKLSAKHKKTPGQILLRWAIQQGLAIIPKTSKAERLQENMDVFDWCLESEEMEAIDALNKNRRYNDPGVFCEKAFGKFFPIYD